MCCGAPESKYQVSPKLEIGFYIHTCIEQLNATCIMGICSICL
jgi:hypothetical protein